MKIHHTHHIPACIITWKSFLSGGLIRVVPVVLLLIAILLGLIMRSLIAPLYLVGSVVLSFGASLGSAVHLAEQITHIILDGIAQGEFATTDPFVSGRAVLTATTRFHDPAHAAEWSDLDIDAAFDGVWSLILFGLSPRTIAQVHGNVIT